ncbi:transcription factor MYB119-like [Aristolochia californica]|uniref:transcription factor MYB119-like n=1 Tax=Aristolochia californica TaxID=171875 RepID=UPI0035DCA63E
MAFMERGVGLGHGFLEKAAHLLRPAPLLTPLDWFRTSSNGFSQEAAAAIQARASESGFRGVPYGATDGPANGFYLPDALEERSFIDGLFVHGDELVRSEGGGRRNDKNSTGKKRSGGSCSAVVKGQWTAEEDSLLLKLVKQHGVRKWSLIAQHLVGRIGKQCRERWHNHLRPDIKKDTWSEDEERLLVEAHEKVGNKWAEIAKRIPGRTENSIKNHWNATKRRQNSRRKSRKTTVQNGKSQPCVLQDYIRSMYYSKEDFINTNNGNNSNGLANPSNLVQATSPKQSSTTNDCLELTISKDENHLLQQFYEDVHTYSPADSSIESSRQETVLGVGQLEHVLLSDDSLLDNEHQLMDMDELAFFAPSPIIDYFSDNSVHEDAATTTAGTTPTSTTSASTHLHSDLYISYLLNGSASGAKDEDEKTNAKLLMEQDQAFSSCREEMDLIEMVSSSQILQSRCRSLS